jgi:CheY-like chemotaxis protein
MMQSIIRDITARAAAAAQLRQAMAEAEQANRAKSEFLSRMSHELRTPLNAILGFAQLLDMGSLTVRQHDSIGQILKGGQHLLALINEVLDISRIDAGHLQLSLEPVTVADLFRETLDLLSPLAARRGVTIQLPVDSSKDAIWADRQRVAQVLLNLVSNAIKYNRDGGAVILKWESVLEGKYRIIVQDTGQGIAAELLPKLFLPFERLGADRGGVEGTGLGLALSRRLVEAMGGVLGVQSTVGQGSIFWFELQQVDTPTTLLTREHAPAQPDEALPILNQTILYIEDNLSNLRLIELILADWPGVRLLSAMQGRLGLELAREHHPDLILLDLHLPDLAGEQVLAQLQADAEMSSIPVFVLSADAQPRQIERLLVAGARLYLTKPLDVRMFRTALHNLFIEGDYL